MPKGYIVGRLDVVDPDAFGNYVAAASVALKKFGVKVLVRGGRSEIVEGDGRTRNVVLEFDSYDLALNYYYSSEYQTAKALRVGAALADIIVLEGA